MAKKRSISAKKDDVHELDIIFPDRPVEITGQSIMIREYPFPDALRLLSVAEPIIKELKDKYVDIPEFSEANETLSNHNEAVCLLISKACEISVEEIMQLTMDEGSLIVGVWWDINKYGLFEYFKESSKNNNKHDAWTSNITYLLMNGVSLEEIKRLTIRQFSALISAVSNAERNKIADMITLVSIGTNGGKETAKIVKSLRKY